MPQTSQPVVDLPTVVQTLIIYRMRWIVPAVVFAVVALGYALIQSTTWEVSQALLVRDEAVGNPSRPGQFDGLDSMKTAQETVLELAKSRSVVAAALHDVGPRSGHVAENWPGLSDIDRARRSIKVTAPNGAEFGRTEVFYIKVKEQDQDRGIAFTKALCEHLDTRLRELRDRKAQSLIDELNHTVALAQSALDTATKRLTETEQEVGSDLAELRILNESTSGESDLRRTLIEVKNELRQARTDQQANEQLLALLRAAEKDPSQLIAAPNRLLQSQSALRQLKDGLVAVKLQTAQLLGELSSEHPKVLAALASQDEIRQHLYGELRCAIAALQAELNLQNALVGDLENHVTDIEGRMSRLAKVRAGYGNLISEVQQRSEILNRAEKDLADAHASQAAAYRASLITLLDGPSVGHSPLGPSRSMIVLAGLLGGLLTGGGIVFLTVPIIPSSCSTAPCGAAELRDESADDYSQNVPHGLSLKQALARILQLTPSWN